MRCAIGCELVGGAAITLGGGASPVGAGAGAGALVTLGGGAPTVGAGAMVGDSRMFGGPPVGRLKISRRLSSASSWSWQLSSVRSARTTMVSALRQWMILSVVLNVGTASVGCWKMTVSNTMIADVDVLMTKKHL